MAQINWGRLILGSLIAAIILFVTDGFIHERIASADWTAVYDGLRATPPEPHGTSMAYFALFELGRGFIAMMFYATDARLLRSRAKDCRTRRNRWRGLHSHSLVPRSLFHWDSFQMPCG